MYYLDNAATTRPYKEVVSIVQKSLEIDFANPSSVHPAGMKARKLINESRETLAKIFSVPQAGILFCGSGTESDNLAIKGILLQKYRYQPEFITNRLEHAAISKTAEWLEEKGSPVHYVDFDSATGQIDINHLLSLINENTRLISIQHVNSETGVIQDLKTISRKVKQKNANVLIHSDGVQAFSKFPIDLNDLGVDLYSISGHKFRGIKGAGALILTSKQNPVIQIHGGGQEHGFRSGTENVPGIAALALAAKLSHEQMTSDFKKVADFREKFTNRLKATFSNIRIYHSENAIPHILSLSFPGVLGEILLNHLAMKEIYVSTGSACNASSKKLSATLQALGFSQNQIKETIRISLNANEIPNDFEDFFEKFKSTIIELKTLLKK
jgi:cysteine desulfurase